MTINFMRSLDYWLGVPLCFLFSIFEFFTKLLGRKKKKENRPLERILFIKLSEMGAIVLSYPLLQRIKEDYPCAEIFFLTFNKNKDIFSVLTGAVKKENIFTIREDSAFFFLLDTIKIIIRMRKRKIGLVFDLEFFSRFTALLSYLIKAGKRIGFYRYGFEGLYRGNLLTHRVQYNPLSHISKSYLSLSQVIKEENKLTPELEKKIEEDSLSLPCFSSNGEAKEKLELKLKRYGVNKNNRIILINCGEGYLPLREWPIGNFIVLSKKLLEDANNYIIMIGARNSSKKEELVCRSLDNIRCLNLTGKTSLLELLELFNISDMLIANDCGLAHLAALVPIKKFIIFGPESPKIFSPLGRNNWVVYSQLPCSPCLSVLNHRNSACRDNRCLKNINPEDVYELIKQSLNSNCTLEHGGYD